MTQADKLVDITEIEHDEGLDTVLKRLAGALVQERGFVELGDEKKREVHSVLRSLESMRLRAVMLLRE